MMSLLLPGRGVCNSVLNAAPYGLLQSIDGFRQSHRHGSLCCKAAVVAQFAKCKLHGTLPLYVCIIVVCRVPSTDPVWLESTFRLDRLELRMHPDKLHSSVVVQLTLTFLSVLSLTHGDMGTHRNDRSYAVCMADVLSFNGCG